MILKREARAICICLGGGAIETNGGYANNVSVVCDTTNNTPDMIANRELEADIVFVPVRAVEAVTVNISNKEQSFNVTVA